MLFLVNFQQTHLSFSCSYEKSRTSQKFLPVPPVVGQGYLRFWPSFMYTGCIFWEISASTHTQSSANKYIRYVYKAIRIPYTRVYWLANLTVTTTTSSMASTRYLFITSYKYSTHGYPFLYLLVNDMVEIADFSYKTRNDKTHWLGFVM